MNLRDLRGGDCCSSQDDCCRRCNRHAETSANGAVRDGARGDTCDAGHRGRRAYRRRWQGVGRCHRRGFPGTPIPSGLTAWSAITADADGHTVDDLRSWAESRADARLDWTAGVLRRLDVHDDGRVTLSDRIDGMLLHPVVGVIVFLAVLFTVFQATTTLASPMQDWIDVTFRGWCTSGLDWLLGLFGAAWRGGWVRSLLVDGVLDGVITVLTFIPVMGIMFLLLSILEDSGYMARAAFVMDCAMRALGLDGRAFLPIIVGFGCNLPALAATRTLPDSRQRVLTGMLVPFAACSARLSVFLVLAHAFFPKYAGLVVFLMYVVSVMIILLVGVMLRHTMFRGLEPEPLMLALPSYQCPRALQLVRSVLLRLWGFVRGASVIIISMIMALWLLQGIPMTAGAGGFAHVDDVHDSAYGVLADAVAPVFAPAGFDDWHASAALITGFVAKEVVIGSMSQSYHADEQPADIVADIAADLKTGMTVPQIADYRRLPSDFVDMAIMRAQERGLVTLMDRAPQSLCDGTACRPDPASLVCAGCPFRAPSSARS